MTRRPEPCDPAEIERALRLLRAPGDIIEIRAIDVRRGQRFHRIVSGYFDNPTAAAAASARLSGHAVGVYTLINPPNPALLARRTNRVDVAGNGDTTSDRDILRREWLLIDCDAKRPAKISATDEEREAAFTLAGQVADKLAVRGWPAPVRAGSGNGAHLLYRIDLPVDDGGLVQRALEALAAEFSTESVKVDTSVHNPARITKVYGTVTMKGDATADRPHRFSRLGQVPNPVAVVPEELLRELAPEKVQSQPVNRTSRNAPGARPAFDISSWVADRIPDARGPATWGGGPLKWEIPVCPWNPDHDAGEAFIAQRNDGAITAGCQHESCTWKWQDLRERLEPGCYDRPHAAAPVREHPLESAPSDDEGDDRGDVGERKSQATELVEMALAAGITSWRTPSDDVYVTLDDGCHLALSDRRVRGRLRRLWFADGRGALRAQSLADAIGTLEGLAYQAGETHAVYRRVAGDERAIYIHLGYGLPTIEVDADGWRIIDTPPVRFAPSAATLPLPMPVPGGSLEELRDLHPALADDDLFALVVSFMVGALRPWGSYAILALIGEQGSAKSSLARLILRLLDPCEAELRSPPRDTRDLAAAVRASRLVALDNVSRIQPWLSDAMCVIATGGTFAARTLYSDSDEHLVRAHQPIVVTAIDEVITAGDLRDRALVVRLPPLADGVRLTDRQVADRVEAARPRILGSVLDLVSRGLRRHADVDGAHVHRLADHVRWSLACEPAPAAVIERVHRAQRTEAAAEQLSDPIGEALLHLGRKGWSGTMSDLLAAVEARVPEDERGREWPESARGAGSALRRRAPALRRAGVEVAEGPGYGPRRDRRGVTMSGGTGATSGTTATSGRPGITHDQAPDVADVGANVRPTSGQRPAKNGNGYAASDVPDIADVLPVPTDPDEEAELPAPPPGWERDPDTGEVYRSCCGSSAQCLCATGDEVPL